MTAKDIKNEEEVIAKRQQRIKASPVVSKISFSASFLCDSSKIR